jgi:hypothetical protein
MRRTFGAFFSSYECALVPYREASFLLGRSTGAFFILLHCVTSVAYQKLPSVLVLDASGGVCAGRLGSDKQKIGRLTEKNDVDRLSGRLAASL